MNALKRTAILVRYPRLCTSRAPVDVMITCALPTYDGGWRIGSGAALALGAYESVRARVCVRHGWHQCARDAVSPPPAASPGPPGPTPSPAPATAPPPAPKLDRLEARHDLALHLPWPQQPQTTTAWSPAPHMSTSADRTEHAAHTSFAFSPTRRGVQGKRGAAAWLARPEGTHCSFDACGSKPLCHRGGGICLQPFGLLARCSKFLRQRRGDNHQQSTLAHPLGTTRTRAMRSRWTSLGQVPMSERRRERRRAREGERERGESEVWERAR